MQFTPILFNLYLSSTAQILGIVFFGFYLSSITWYWLLPSDQETTVNVALFDDNAGMDMYAQIPLSTTLISVQNYNPWGEIAKKPKIIEKASVKKKKVEKVVVSKLNVELVGTMVQDGLQSVAFLVDLGSSGKRRGKRAGKQQKMMYVGDQIQGAELEKIERNAVYLRNGTQLEIVRLKSELLERKELLPDHLQSTNKSNKGLTRKEWVTLIDQGVSLLRGLEITPYYQGRHSIGYRINIISERPIYKKIGIASGDIIKSVNGTPVTKAKEILSSISELKKTEKLQIEIMRKHKPETLILHIGE